MCLRYDAFAVELPSESIYMIINYMYLTNINISRHAEKVNIN